MSSPIFTVGHDLLDAEQLTAPLTDAGIRLLVDVRRSRPAARPTPDGLVYDVGVDRPLPGT